jgi:hypothetical protein
MRIASPIAFAGSIWMLVDFSYTFSIANDDYLDVLLVGLVGAVGSGISGAYMLVSWVCGWKKEKNDE